MQCHQTQLQKQNFNDNHMNLNFIDLIIKDPNEL
jgi:hypothetical protein